MTSPNPPRELPPIDQTISPCSVQMRPALISASFAPSEEPGIVLIQSRGSPLEPVWIQALTSEHLKAIIEALPEDDRDAILDGTVPKILTKYTLTKADLLAANERIADLEQQCTRLEKRVDELQEIETRNDAELEAENAKLRERTETAEKRLDELHRAEREPDER
jgi:hypothetical protein